MSYVAEGAGGYKYEDEADAGGEEDAGREEDEGLFSLHVFVRESNHVPRHRAVVLSLVLLGDGRGGRVCPRSFGFIPYPGERN